MRQPQQAGRKSKAGLPGAADWTDFALVARAHGVPFYVIGPTSTIDLSVPDGDAIPFNLPEVMVAQVQAKVAGDPPELTDQPTRDFIGGQLAKFDVFVRRLTAGAAAVG